MKYPDGKMNNNDEGELKMAIYIKEGRVILDFRKEISWIGFDKKTLRALIDGLEDKYKKI